MTRIGARLAAIAAVRSAILTPAAAQHEHHCVTALDTLTLGAERDVVQLRSGATVVDTRASAAAGGSIAELLRTVPGIELDADGRISMRGSTSVLVLMNGRRIPLTGDALVAFLRQMPAAALERVEAGTTATYDHYMGSAATTGDAGDVLNWDVMYSLSGMRPRADSKTVRWSLVPGDLPFQTDQDSRAREKHRLHSVLAGAAATPTPNTSVARLEKEGLIKSDWQMQENNSVVHDRNVPSASLPKSRMAAPAAAME